PHLGPPGPGSTTPSAVAGTRRPLSTQHPRRLRRSRPGHHGRPGRCATQPRPEHGSCRACARASPPTLVSGPLCAHLAHPPNRLGGTAMRASRSITATVTGSVATGTSGRHLPTVTVRTAVVCLPAEVPSRALAQRATAIVATHG